MDRLGVRDQAGPAKLRRARRQADTPPVQSGHEPVDLGILEVHDPGEPPRLIHRHDSGKNSAPRHATVETTRLRSRKSLNISQLVSLLSRQP
jgi:hypothetical protein